MPTATRSSSTSRRCDSRARRRDRELPPSRRERNALGPAVVAIAGSPIAARLRRLELEDTGVDDDAAVAIANSADLVHLRMLDLSGNPVGERGLLALAASPHLRELVWLNLYNCPVTDRARAALRDRFGRRALT